MTKRPPTLKELQDRYGADVEIRRQFPSRSEIQQKDSRLELVASAFGIQRWMWKTRMGNLIGIILVPATISGIVSFWGPVLTTTYDYAAPYIAMVSEAALDLSDELIVFGDASGTRKTHDDGQDRPSAIIVPKIRVALAGDHVALAGDIETIQGTFWRVTHRRYPPLVTWSSNSKFVAGRWSSPGGLAPLYAAEDPLLAIGEFARIGGKLLLSSGFMLHELSVTGTLESAPEHLVDRNRPDALYASRAFGDQWMAENRTSILATPSVIDPSRRNFILNLSDPENLHVTLKRSIPITPDMFQV
ncbi:RES family NAD+ phosphorylase [Halomonas sp. Bachu 37]|uniref:RES family NAD+ phosphorylase n=1 Tax=Halomonas kashgarensis TaxID=3084920 RepID=UPI003217112B